MKTKRVLSLVLVICLCLSMVPVVTMQAEAAGYYSDSALSNIKCSILSNTARANYVNAMMKYHIQSSTDNYRVARNLENGSSVVFFFDGCSDNLDSPTYSNYNKYRLSAYCAVVQKVNGVLKVVYESENCSTIPDNPRNVSLNDNTAVPTVLDGVYNIISTNHLSRYASLRIADNSGSAPAIRCTSSSSYISSSNGINIHARSNFSSAPTNGISSTSYSSTGCFIVGLTDNTWSEYNKFIDSIFGISNAIITTPYSSGSWTKCTSGNDKGVVIVDRSQYKSQLAAIYGGDNSHSASALVSKITAYTDNLDYSGGHTTHSYSGSYYEAAHPHKVYQMCSCGATRYTGATTTVSSCGSCNPVSVSSKYNSVLPFRAYLKGTSKVYPYSSEQLATQTGGEIWATDECTITAVYSNGACKVTYPVGSTTKTAYTSLSNFVDNTSTSLTKQTMNHQVTTYIRASTGSTAYGYTGAGDVIYKLGSSGSMTQIFYPASGGHKLAWVQTSELVAPTYDNRFNPYCPIKGYPCTGYNFDVYASDYTTYYGKIFSNDYSVDASDYCTINAVYADGWCQVSYPTSSGTKTAYTPLSSFVYNVSASHVKYTSNAQIKVYATKSLTVDPSWHISAGDVFYVVGTYGSGSQVLYPIDAQYGGGYKLGWIYTSSLPKTTYTVSYNANGGSGAPSSQTKTHGVALTLSSAVPDRPGYAFAGWSTSASATSASYMPSASYLADADLTLYAVWTLNKYEITYNANGGINAPATQNKAHGTNLTLSSGIPTKTYTVTFNANGGTVDVASRQVACDFLGWAISSTATSATYQPGASFTTNANTTLYAVWKNPELGQYSIPVREGYVFDGWYTEANGGTQVTLTSVITANTTVYAHWVLATYGINYDANGGTNAPEAQVKTHGNSLTLSTTVPVRENYSFLGWATEENPTVVQYQPGDIYSADSDIMLVAVWKCNLNPTITVGTVSGNPGDTVVVPVSISENPGIIAALLKISYDADVLILTNVEDGGILGEYKFSDALTDNPYVVSWSNGAAENDFTATGTLVYLTFTISENADTGESPVTVSCNAEEIYNKNLEQVSVTMQQGMVNVEKTKPVLTLSYPSLSFEDEILYNVYYSVDDASSVVEMGLLTFETRDENGTIDTALDIIPGYANSGATYMVQSKGIPAKNLGDALYFKVYAKLSDGSYVYSDVAGYSAVAYAKSVLSSTTSSMEAKALMVAMLNYGTAAQEYFGYKTDAPMNSFLSAAGKALVAEYDSSMVADVVKADTSKVGPFVMNGGYSNIWPTVSFEGAFSINFYFTPNQTVDSAPVLYYWDAETYNNAAVLSPWNATGVITMTQDSGNWGAAIDGIAAKAIDETIYVAGFYNSNGVAYPTGIIAYSLGNYCKTIAANGNDFGAATAVYGYYAKAYFA